MLKTIQARALGNTVEAQFKELRSATFILELVPLVSLPIDFQLNFRATQVAWHVAMLTLSLSTNLLTASR